MRKQQNATNLLTRFILILVFTAHLSYTARALSGKKLCVDENCKENISLGTGLLDYIAGEKGMISFKKGADIQIKSKSIGSPSMWGIEVGDREGYAPKRYIRETKILVKEKNLITVDVDPKKTVPILATSEKLLEQENTSEVTTTKPLNLSSEESIENTLKSNSEEKVIVGSSLAATPVKSEIVDGTKIPSLSNDMPDNDKNVHGNVQNVNKLESTERIINHENEDNSSGGNDKGQMAKNSEKSYSEESLVATPVQSEIGDGTKIPTFSNDLPVNDKNVHGNVQNVNKLESSERIINHENKDNSSGGNDKGQMAKNSEKIYSEEKIIVGSSLAATPIQSEIGDSTKIPDNDKNVHGNAQTVNKLGAMEQLTKQENEDIDFGRMDKNQLAENSGKEANISELNINDVVEESGDKLNDITNKAKSESREEQYLSKDVGVENANGLDKHIESADSATRTNSEIEKNQVDIAQIEDKLSNSATFQKPVISSGSSVEENEHETNKNMGNIADPTHSEQKQSPIIETEKIPNSIQQVTLKTEENKTIINDDLKNVDMMGLVKQDGYNSTKSSSTNVNKDNSSISEDQQVHLKTETLNETTSEHQTNKHFENKEIINDNYSITQQEVPLTEKNNDEIVKENLKTDKKREDENLNSLFEETQKENLVKEQVTTESSTVLKADEIPQTLDDNSQPNGDGKIGNLFSTKNIVEENFSSQYSQNNITSESEELSTKSDEYKTANNDGLESAKNDMFVNKPNGIEEISNSNSRHSDISINEKEKHTEQLDKETPSQEFETYTKETFHSGKEVKTSSDSLLHTEDATSISSEISGEVQSQGEIVLENFNTSTYNPNVGRNDVNSYQEISTTSRPTNDNYRKESEDSEQNSASVEEQTTESYNSAPTMSSERFDIKSEPKVLPSSTPFHDFEGKENKGLFATIMGTVNNILSSNKKNKQNELDSDLDRILYSKSVHQVEKLNKEESFHYCKNIGPNGECPEPEQREEPLRSHFDHTTSSHISAPDITFDNFLKSLASKMLEISELLAFLGIVAAATLFFIFGYYCFCNNSREGDLLLRLNQLESSLLASHKENAILKHNLMSTRQKLSSIEDNSFGSNDMVVSLKKELEGELVEKSRLQEQITVLQKELENAADAGIELNKIVSELLSNQTGDESIISSVEELQKQLNEQQNTIFEINASLAEKSRENSELQLLLAEQNARYEAEIANLQRDNDELEHEKGSLLTRVEEMKNDFDKDITAALEGKNMEIKRLQNEIIDLTNKLENEHTKWQTSVAKIEALEECLKNIRRDPSVNITEVIDVANVKAQFIEMQKKYKSLKDKLETELDSRKLAENQLEIITAEVEKLKQDFNQSEKDKLEAQTRLEVLSNYFKDKENQLQKELSLKEAMWLKQQGETTTTVDRLTAMQEEIQSLKSQNDSLRAEIEAQVAAHKAQIGTLENRAHETWLAARQSDRRYEEARSEATALRRKLTALAGGNLNEINKPSAGSAALGDELTQAPSPIHMESPGSPILGRMPPPPFLPPPFMGHPPPFMGMPPPPPFVPPGEMRPAPLGRIMSPPPQRSGRFSPQHLDYADYLDYESNNTWHRHTYSPPPRTYRSLSPTDSRYNYGTERDLMSTYDTETDFSPPPSPRESRRRAGNSSERIDSNTKISYGNTQKFNTSNKGPFSSGSEKSFNTPSHNETKTRKGNSSSGGKTLV